MDWEAIGSIGEAVGAFAAAVSFTTSKQERGAESAMLQVEYFTQMIKAVPGSIPEWERLRPITAIFVPELDEVVLNYVASQKQH